MVSKYLEALISEFSKIPGMGQKSAARAAFYILKLKDSDVKRFASALIDIKEKIRECSVCGGISDADICSICSDQTRDSSLICVVEDEKDILTIEKTRIFKGVYHVLKGVISPLDGIGPDDLRINELYDKCKTGKVREIILATNPTLEGDATSLYLTHKLKDMNIRVMRISRGLPVGGELDFADTATIARSFDERIEVF